MPAGGGAANAGVLLPMCGTKEKKGNMFRYLVISVLWMIITLYCTTWISPFIKDFCLSSGITVPDGVNVTAGVLGHPLAILALKITQFFMGLKG